MLLTPLSHISGQVVFGVSYSAGYSQVSMAFGGPAALFFLCCWGFHHLMTASVVRNNNNHAIIAASYCVNAFITT